MIIIKNVSDKYFSLNGVNYAKIYQPLKQGVESIGVFNIYDTKQSLVSSVSFYEFQIDGVVYGSQSETILELLNVVYSSIIYDVNLSLSLKTDKGGYSGTSQDLKNEIDSKAFEGLVTYQTKAELDAVDPFPSEGTPAKVANDDVDPENNGYYSVVSGVWVKDADLYENKVSSLNISKGVTGKAVSDFVEEKFEGYELGEFVNTGSYGNQQNSLYLSLIAEIGKYDSAEIKTNSLGEIKFLQYRDISGTFTLINSAVFVGGKVDLTGFVFEEGDYLGTLMNNGSGGVEFSTTGGSTKYISNQTSVPATISSGSLLSATFRFSLLLKKGSEIEPIVESLVTDYSYSKKEIETIVSSNYKKVGNIIYSNFRNSNLPVNWVNSGFTLGVNGLQSPVSGDVNTIIEYDQYSNLDSFVTLFKFKMNAFSNVLLTNYHKKLSTSGGHIVGFDFVNGNIKIYKAEVKGVLPSVVLVEKTIPFTIKNADTVVRYERNADIEKITVTNAENNYSFEYDANENSVSTGQGYDKFGLVFLSGDIIVNEAQYSCQLPSEPDILIVGDSIVNGDVIRSLVGGGSSNRWAGLVSSKTLTSIASLGGNTVGDIARDLPFYLSLFSPKKIIYGVGINNSVLSDYTSAADSFISLCESNNIEPILQTLHPRSGREQYCEDVSNWVKERGVRYLDFRKVLTVNGLGATNNSSLFLSDNLHPNVEGNLRMFKEAESLLEL